MTDDITDNLADVYRRIAAAAVGAGRNPESVRLLAVSKRVAVERIRSAYATGQRLFGENLVQELQTKATQLPADCEWHFIGHLQANKVRATVAAAAWIHSVDSLKLLERVDRIAGEEGRRPAVLLQLNVSGEVSKFGAGPSAAAALLEKALSCPHVDCRGFMTMAPFDAEEGVLRRIFSQLRTIRDRLESEFSVKLPDLSMGMSDDFEIAIEEGATIVRVGAAVFGGR